MLSQVRNTLKGAVAWFVIVLLILAFALFGVPEISQFAGNSAVTVGNQRFSPQYVQNEFNRAVQMQTLESGGSYSREEAIATGLPNQIIQSISTTAALDQFADKMRLSAPRSLLRDYLNENEGLQNPATGKFDQSVLFQILQRYSMTVEEFEQRISSDLARDQLIASLSLSADAPPPLTEYWLMRESERREIAYLIVTDAMAGEAAEPTDDDLQAYYDAHPQDFTAPEYRTFELLSLRAETFADGIDVSEEELRRIYDNNRARLYEKPELRTLYQITLDSEAAAQAATGALRQGRSFEEIAIENGRTLEGVTFNDARQSDILDPSVAEAAFAEGLGEGSIIDPVEGLFGWTIVQIAGVTAPELTEFEDVREDILKEYLARDTRRAVIRAVEEIEEVRDTGASLADAADAAGFELQTVGPVDRFSFAPGGAIINDIPGEALAEAFILDEDEQSEALRLADDGGYLFVSVKEITSAALRPFEDVREAVETAWRNEERADRIAATVAEIRTKAGETSLVDVAAEYERTPISLVIDRRFVNEAVSADLRETIFKVAPGDLVDGPAGLGDAHVIVDVQTVAVSLAGVSADQEAFYGEYLGYQLDQELVNAFLGAVQDEYNVKINQAQIDALFRDQ